MAAAGSLDKLRSLYAEQRVKCLSKSFQSKLGRDERDGAAERPGLRVFRNEETLATRPVAARTSERLGAASCCLTGDAEAPGQ